MFSGCLKLPVHKRIGCTLAHRSSRSFWCSPEAFLFLATATALWQLYVSKHTVRAIEAAFRGKGLGKNASLRKSNWDFHCASLRYIWHGRNCVETQRFSQWKSILRQNLVSRAPLQIKQQFNQEGYSRQTITSRTQWLFAVGHAKHSSKSYSDKLHRYKCFLRWYHQNDGTAILVFILSFVSKIKIKPCSFTNCLVCKFSILEAEAVSLDFSDTRNPATLFCLGRLRVILVAHPKQKCLAHLLKQFSEMQRLAGASYPRRRVNIPCYSLLYTFRQR